MKIYKLLVIYLTIIPSSVSGQVTGLKALETTIHSAIAKAYPAAVRVWAYDTISGQQMGARFSAVVVSLQGDILTAAHTTMPGKTYKVMFPDGKEAIAQALGKIELADDPTVPDVAVMKIITPGTWPYAEMGYSSSLKINQPCISIAYPESLDLPQPGVRFGYIMSPGNDRGFLQSTCIMEPGDSGGPLFDCLGRVIGIHSAIGISESLNYEIPVDLYRKYKTALSAGKKYNALPALADTIGNDPLAAQIQQYLQPADLPAAFNSHKNTCLLITSKVKDKEEKIYGTAFAGGHIVSKSSMVGAEPVIHYKGKIMAAAIVLRDRESDLVLLHVKEEMTDSITFTKAKPGSLLSIRPGQFLVSPSFDTADIISIAGTFPFGLPKISSTGFLGASIAYKSGPLLLTFIRSNSPAAVNNLQEGDELISINGVVTGKAEDYYAELQKYWPGDTVIVCLKRQGERYTKQIVLAEKPQAAASHPAEMFKGGKSRRRDGFARVFVHDAVLTPDQCGGPVFDAEGNFQGINIARYSRTGTLVLPAEVIQVFLKNKEIAY